jgi:hypothetical protein
MNGLNLFNPAIEDHAHRTVSEQRSRRQENEASRFTTCSLMVYFRNILKYTVIMCYKNDLEGLYSVCCLQY